MSNLSHRLCSQKRIGVLGYPGKRELCGCPVILSIVFLQQRISPPNSVPKALCAALADACCGVLDVVPGNSCWDANVCTLLAGGVGCAGAPTSAEHGASPVTCGSEENVVKGKIQRVNNSF